MHTFKLYKELFIGIVADVYFFQIVMTSLLSK